MPAALSPPLPSRVAALASIVLLCLASRTIAKEVERVPELASIEQAKPGQVFLLAPVEGMSAFIRVPEGFDPRRGARLIVFLHGSNMNGLSYVRSFEARDWCEDDVLVCPNGEKGDDPYGACNFSFTSASMVAAITRKFQETLRITRTYVGGHSQGGFLTYSVIMRHPDLYQGAFPMAGDCWSQNEPNLWEDEPELLTAQRRIAIAVIHGRSDPVVAFSQGQHAHDVFEVMGYPRLALFAPEELGHQFMLSPVAEALDWLDAMLGANPGRAMELAGAWAKEGEWGWALAAAGAVKDLPKAPGGARKTAKALLKAGEAVAKQELPRLVQAMNEAPAREWLPRFYRARHLYGATRVAAPVVERYEQLRQEQRQAGANLFSRARQRFQAGDEDGGRALLDELLEQAPASYHAYYALPRE